MGMEEEPLRKESFKWFPKKAHELLDIRIIVFDAHSARMIKVAIYTAVAAQHMLHRQVISVFVVKMQAVPRKPVLHHLSQANAASLWYV
jgi:hypothetical protein